jgi:tetratricopeptide (TPR) repeat protein
MRSPCLVVAMLLASGLTAPVRAETRPGVMLPDPEPELAREPSWVIPTRSSVRDRALTWAAEVTGAEGTASEVLARVAELWAEPGVSSGAGPTDLVDTAMATAAIIDPRAAAVRGAPERRAGVSPVVAWLDDGDTAPFERDAVKLWLGRELVRLNRFDEALPLLTDLDLATSVDPAAALFYRGCCEHWLLSREAAAETFDRLLERERELPVRYARLARLFRADIARLEADSLDHIARRMRDVRRRLDLGHAGPAARQVQRGVIESLDKLIEQIENQQQQGQSAAAGAAGAGERGDSSRPMEDSRIAGGRGAGEVRSRDLGSGAGWGNLPPHEREAALQQIGREYPPHYREAIEQYFKRLATGEDRSP